MNIDSNCNVSITEANSPEYRLTDPEQVPGLKLTEDEAIGIASARTFGVDGNNALHSFAHADGAYHLMGLYALRRLLQQVVGGRYTQERQLCS